MPSDASIISDVPADSDWVAITTELPTEIEVSVSPKSINRSSDNVVRAWIEYKYSRPRSFGSKFVKTLMVHNEYYCSERKYKILQSEAHFTDGTHERDFSERQGYALADDPAFRYLCGMEKGSGMNRQ